MIYICSKRSCYTVVLLTKHTTHGEIANQKVLKRAKSLAVWSQRKR